MEKNLQIIQEDEIDLRELFNTIKKHKYKIFFLTFLITFLTLIYTLSLPNIYKSQTILIPESQKKSLAGGSMAALASLAGVNLGGGDNDDPSIIMEELLKDYQFNLSIIKKYKLDEKLKTPYKNLVFAMGEDRVYKFFHSPKKEKNLKSKEEIYFDTFNNLKTILSLTSDKKTGFIILSATYQDRFLAKELVDIYLKELINNMKTRDFISLDKQLNYYKKELEDTFDISLKEQLSKYISGIMQKKVFSQVNEFYLVKQIIKPKVAYIKDKAKPKRALILIVAMITSLILSIFLVFFIEFLKNDKNN